MPLTEQVWIVDDDSSIRWVMEKALTRAGLTCRLFETGQAVLDALASQEPMVVVSDIRMPGMDGLHLLSKIKAKLPHLPVIITTAHSDLDSAVNSYEEGAFEYLPKPFDIEEMVSVVSRAQAQRSQTVTADVASPNHNTTEIIGNAAAMQEVFRAIGRLAHSHITVLINGESGTGKELVARALHRHSPRANSAFVALNMAAIPQELMESELFGHEKGAFTGANNRRAGRFEQAKGGTLFLDEIGDMPAATQTRLLRVLQDGEFFALAALIPSQLMCALSPLHIKILRPWLKPARSEKICSIDSMSFGSCPQTRRATRRYSTVTQLFFNGSESGAWRRDKKLIQRRIGLFDSVALAGQCQAVRKYLPVAHGDGGGTGGTAF